MMSEPLPPTDSTIQLTAQRAPAPWKRWLLMGLGGVILVVAVIWFLQRNRESTDDAFIEANIVEISPHVSGYVQQVVVVDNQRVAQGQLLLQMDSRDYDLRVRAAEAVLAAAQARHGANAQDVSVVTTTTQAIVQQAQQGLISAQAEQQRAQAESEGAAAQAQLAQGDVVRYQTLFAKEELSRQRLDQAQTSARASKAQWEAAQRRVSVAQAQVGEARAKLAEALAGPRQVALKQAQEVSGQASVAQAEANLSQARLDLAYTHMSAPVAGKVTRKNVLPGQWIQPGNALLALVSGPPWVVANFKETQLTRMRLGQKVTLKIDAFPDQQWRGHIDSFQAGTGARFSLLPPENATGNFVKVVQRVPVKIVFDESPERLNALAPGMSVTPVVALDSSASP